MPRVPVLLVSLFVVSLALGLMAHEFRPGRSPVAGVKSPSGESSDAKATARVAGAAVAPTPSNAPPVATAADLQSFSAALKRYLKGDRVGGDALAAQIGDADQRAALEWATLKTAPAPDENRLAAFAKAHPDWPGLEWIRAQREASMFQRHAEAAEIEAEFAKREPASPFGALLLARADLARGRQAEAIKRVSRLWRERDLDVAAEAAVALEFMPLLTPADHRYRADRLLYAEKPGPAMRAAGRAGADYGPLAQVRLIAAHSPLTAEAIAAVPLAEQGDPGFLFARVQDARRAGRTEEAEHWLRAAPRDPALLIDVDKWWSERRMVARQWLDKGEPQKAYALALDGLVASDAAKADQQFHAGWMALTFLKDAKTAADHFAAGADAAKTPWAQARAFYWRGRAAEAAGDKDQARAFYERAAAYPIAYYGQMAALKLGRPQAIAPRPLPAAAAGRDRWLTTRVVELLLSAGAAETVAPLINAAASQGRDEAQLAALGQVLAARASAPIKVSFGKIAIERGFALDTVAFPTDALPDYAPLPNSADVPSLLAVARQESEFRMGVVSAVGARGIMQLMPVTAASVAGRAGVNFDLQRLSTDAGYNLALGAALLGSLIVQEQGSRELAFAAYNAGAARVAQWVAQYGDPRSGAVDPVDWVERIPFDETRNYVERAIENYNIYRARLATP